MAYEDNVTLIERFNGTLSAWTLDQTGGTVTIVTQDFSTKMKLDDTSGSGLVSAIKTFTEPSTAYIIECDIKHAASSICILELLDSGNNPIVTVDLGTTAATVSFDTDNATPSTLAFPAAVYKQVILVVDPVGNTVKCYISQADGTNGSLDQVGGTKSYTGATITQMKFKTDSTATGIIYVDEIKIYTPELAIIGDSVSDGKRYWSTHPEYPEGRLAAQEDETSPPHYQIGLLFDASNYWVGNRGFGGSNISNVNTNVATALLDHGFTKVTVAVGHNDIVNGQTLAQMKTDYNSLITTIQGSITGNNIILCNVFPGADINTDLEISIKEAFNSWLYYRAVEIGAKYVDLNEALRDPASKNSILAAYDDADAIHLVPAGTVVMAQTIYDVLILVEGNNNAGNNNLRTYTASDNQMFPMDYIAPLGAIVTGTSNDTDKPNQNKVFYHDGDWWGCFESSDWYLFKYDSVNWTQQTAAPGIIDDRGTASPDCIIDSANNKLYIMVDHGSTVEFQRLTYAAGQFTIDSGFPKSVSGITGGSDRPCCFVRGKNGTLYAFDYDGGSDVEVNWSTDDGVTWQGSTTIIKSSLPNSSGLTDAVAFTWDSNDYIGVFYGPNTISGSLFGFLRLQDGADPSVVGNWTDETANLPAPTSGDSDDHVGAAVDANGNCYFAVKIGNPNSGDADIAVYKRDTATPTAGWTLTFVADTSGTRPCVSIDTENDKIYCFYTSGSVAYHVSDLGTLSFGSLANAIQNTGESFSNCGVAEHTVDGTKDLMVYAGNTTVSDVWYSLLDLPVGAGVTVTPAAITCVAATVDPPVVLGSISITPVQASSVASKVDPTVIKGSISLSPAIASAVGATVDPTVIAGGGVIVAPAPISSVAGKVDPSAIEGSINITPSMITAVSSTLNPTVLLSSVSFTPSQISAIGMTVNPTVQAGGVFVTPSPVSCVAEKVDPVVRRGSLTIIPVAVSALVEKVDPTVLFGSVTATPSAISAIGLTVNPTVLGGASIIIQGGRKGLIFDNERRKLIAG